MKPAIFPIAIFLLNLSPVFGVGPSFRPDATFRGSTLKGWHSLGAARWTARDGEITGEANSGGGWLMLDRSYQDAGFYTSFRCSAGCRTGVLLRAEKTPEGYKGIFVSLSEGDLASYRMTLDADGKETGRERLRFGGGMNRIAPPANPNQPGRGGRGRGGRGRGADVNLPLQRPDTALRADDWNQIEIFIDANIVRSFLNNGGEVADGVADDDAGRYGPMALYVGGGEVHFKDVAYKDLGLKEAPAEKVSPNFRMQRISDFYYSWGAAAADVNHDGILDIVSGPYYYLGPDYTKRREIYPAVTKNPGTQYTTDSWMEFAADFTGDGWPDVITASFSQDGEPGGDVGVWLYVNPKGELRRWDKYLVVPAFQSEIAVLRDVDGDGKPALVYMADGYVRYAKPDPSNPTGPWVVRTISEHGYGTAHGIGVGDVNGDGRMDIVNAYGWWEHPASDDGKTPWTYHPQAFARYGRNIFGGSVMAVYDVNGDGLNDVVTVLDAHGYGLAWFEQKKDASGSISFVEHMIMDDQWTKNAGGVTFSEPHGTTFADVDGDGIPDFIVGKRYWAHKDDYLDPDPYGPPVLYWYRTMRNPAAPGGAEFVPELIHNRSGAGSDVLAVDLNKDGAMDIVTATKLGTFIFWGKPRSASRQNRK